MRDDELLEGLRRVAATLDRSAGPIGSDEAVDRPAVAEPARRMPLLVAAAVALVAVVVGAVVLANRPAEDQELISRPPPAVEERDGTTPSSPATTTSPPTTAGGAAGRLATDWDALPEWGFGLVEAGGLVTLLGADGSVIEETDQPLPVDQIGIGPVDLGFDGEPGVLPAARPSLAGPTPADCDQGDVAITGTTTGGPTTVAVCGRVGAQEIVLVDEHGAIATLAGRPPGTEGGEGEGGPSTGTWLRADPSPDGRWVAAQWRGCGSGVTYLISTEAPSVLPVSGAPAAGTDVPSSGLVGWTPTGQLAYLAGTGTAGCGSATDEPVLHLLDPAGGTDVVLAEVDDLTSAWIWHKTLTGRENPREQRLGRALAGLGLEQCCGEPSHGGSGATMGAVWEGLEVGISAIEPGSRSAELPSELVPLRGTGQARLLTPAEGPPSLAFVCGDSEYLLGGWSEAGADVLRAVADALVPYLGCTLGPPPTR